MISLALLACALVAFKAFTKPGCADCARRAEDGAGGALGGARASLGEASIRPGVYDMRGRAGVGLKRLGTGQVRRDKRRCGGCAV